GGGWSWGGEAWGVSGGPFLHVALNLSPSRLAAIVSTARNLDDMTICRYGAAIQEWPTWTNAWIDAISSEAWAWRQQSRQPPMWRLRAPREQSPNRKERIPLRRSRSAI